VPPLRRCARLYITGLTALAIACLSVLLARTSRPDAGSLLLSLGLLAALSVAIRYPLPFAWKTRLYLDTCVVMAAVLLLEPGPAMLLVVLAPLSSGLRHRDGRAEVLFYSSQMGLQAAAGSLTLAALGWDIAAPPFDRPAALLAVLAAGIVMYLVNTVSVATIVGLQESQSPARVWFTSTSNIDRAEAAAHLAQVGVGLLTAIVADAHPWAVVLLALPTVAVYASLDRHVKIRRSVEAALARSEANLAEAQRVARLGSWEWDLLGDDCLWSEQALRVLGLPHAPGGADPGWRDYLAVVHAEDRAAVERALTAAHLAGEPFRIDHRIVLADSAERVVHAQGEVVVEDGRPARLVATLHDITERKRLEERLAFQAYHDALTALPNRALFREQLELALATAGPRHGTLAVLCRARA
jgi:PAS domain-containing protein